MIDIIYRYDPDSGTTPAQPATPIEARERLTSGNREFVSLIDHARGTEPATRVLSFDPADLGVADVVGRAPRQKPFALVLGCSDARVPIEMIFSQACNALFVVRVAGNVLGNECLGSIDYAVRNLDRSLRLLVVLGHSHCGALTAAVDAFVNPSRYLSVASTHALRAIVDRLFVAVQAAAQSLERAHGCEVGRSPGYRSALIESSVILNAALTAKTLRREFREDAAERIEVVYSLYDLTSGVVTLPTAEGPSPRPSLFDPPNTEDEFAALGIQVASCPMIVGLLNSSSKT